MRIFCERLILWKSCNFLFVIGLLFSGAKMALFSRVCRAGLHGHKCSLSSNGDSLEVNGLYIYSKFLWTCFIERYIFHLSSISPIVSWILMACKVASTFLRGRLHKRISISLTNKYFLPFLCKNRWPVP